MKKFLGLSRLLRATAIILLAVGLQCSIAASPLVDHSTPQPQSYDVIVYGATPSGIAASVAAARENKSVALIEPLPLVGGVMSGGLSFSDSNQMARETLGGIFEEFHRNVEKHYQDAGTTLPYRVSEKNNKPWTYEPHVAEQVFQDLLKRANVHVFLNELLTTATITGTTITRIATDSGKVFTGKIFIDASYEGDLLAAAGVSYRVGREARSEYGESLAGAHYPKKPVTNVDAFGKDGKPLPLINETTTTTEGSGDKRIMAYSFRFCFSRDPQNQVPIKKPDGYDPAQFELLGEYLKANPETRRVFDLYPIPGNKLDGNNGIGLQISLALVGESAGYPEGTPAQRAKIWAKYRHYSEGLFYFLKTDSRVPAHIRQTIDKIGYAKDEFVKFGNFPPVLYVREGRRMLGQYTMTQTDILTRIKKDDSIGVGSFPIDSHDCQRIALPSGGFINEGSIFPKHIKGRKIGQPYQIPYGAILPRSSQCTNLLVPVSLSASHVAFSSIRVEPAWIVLGQSAGIAAAVAIESGTTVQHVPYPTLETRLRARGQILAFPE